MRLIACLLPLLTACAPIDAPVVELDDSVDTLLPGSYRASFELEVVRSFADLRTSKVGCEDHFTLYVDPEAWPEVSGLVHCDIDGDSRTLTLSGSFTATPEAEGEIEGGGLAEYWDGGMTSADTVAGAFHGVDTDGQNEVEVVGWFNATWMDESLERRQTER